ncbi:hypothetical protein CYMTET_55974 [Cymbomonas tetramitiformis]|uniref:Uncharacterized protein n=1 Tax=Cymbomonas tetramitiformis TaxID=36881 RepID=A0AAE0BBW2_9CHLO|nr:hypothetical protein CYMTET_55974 [Cymbomonas tetramitiformis]
MSLPERIEGKVHRQVAKIISRLLTANSSKHSGASIKSLTLAPRIIAKKATHALTCETLKYLPVIREVIAATRLMEHNEVPIELAYVLVYEVLFGQGCRSVADEERYILAQKAKLKGALSKHLTAAGVKSAADLLSMDVRETAELQRKQPRFVRVNTLKCTVQHALKSFKKFSPVVDEHLDDLLVLPPGTDLHKHPLVLSGEVVLQGKGSCMSAHAVAPEPGWSVVDACAAPALKAPIFYPSRLTLALSLEVSSTSLGTP